MITYKKFISFLLPWFTLALIMNMTRFVMTDIHSYIYMNWNLFLAIIPLLALYFFERMKNIYRKGFLFFIWFFFLPNAVYMVTDLIHLRYVGPEWLLWFDGTMIFSYALIGVFVSAYTITAMKKNIFKEGKNKQHMFMLVIAMLVSFGIYLGRYVRFNSWDIITNPIGLAENILHIITTDYGHPVLITTIIFFTLFTVISTLSLDIMFVKEKED